MYGRAINSVCKHGELMLEVIKFHPEHVKLAKICGQDTQEFLNEGNLNLLSGKGHIAGTFVVDGRICAFAGMVIDDSDAGYVWLIPTVYLEKHVIIVVRALKRYLTMFARLFDLKSFVTNGHDDEVVIKWLNYMGFKRQNDLYVKEL